MLRLFVDTNTFVSGTMFQGNEADLLLAGRFGAVRLVTNEFVIAEVRDVLSRPHIGLSAGTIEEAVKRLRSYVQVLADPTTEGVNLARARIPDPDDALVLAGFEESKCDALVTGDRKLRGCTPKGWTTAHALAEISKFPEEEYRRHPEGSGDA